MSPTKFSCVVWIINLSWPTWENEYRGWLKNNVYWPKASKIFEQLAPSKIPLAREMSVHIVDRCERGGLTHPPKKILVLFWQNPAIWEFLIQYLERNVVLKKSHFYTEQSLMITFFIPEYIIWCHFSLLCCMPLIFYAPTTKSRRDLLIYPLSVHSSIRI